MKLSTIIKELQMLDNPMPTNDELSACTNKFDKFKEELTGMASRAIKSIPLTQSKIGDLTGISQVSISLLKNPQKSRTVSLSIIIKVMMKLGYNVEIKFTRIEK